MSSSFWRPPSAPATSSSWTILAVTRARPCAALIRAAGAKLFSLLRYSPHLNPIEQVFAKLKTLLRKTDPRTIEATGRGIGDLLGHVTPAECANYLANAGYASA